MVSSFTSVLVLVVVLHLVTCPTTTCIAAAPALPKASKIEVTVPMARAFPFSPGLSARLHETAVNKSAWGPARRKPMDINKNHKAFNPWAARVESKKMGSAETKMARK